ncbi:FAD-binding domain-containing protein [Pseudovirgaria hyperparasitica]|uniref:FAD-binding domain-containing protein n=1 Tax=Pseudovirgaria hyperparasitica TaxID=470096 RepID=A0A6A6WHP2_9PEZI|nr:FAD-binding domain-containing protein [Pseudovirgaria hyperparasitica]KAF2761167.1 FAD-binding domain-containing protein [Pseudovirgaria hyperparasitica]
MLLVSSLWLLAASITQGNAYLLGRSPITECLDDSSVPQVAPGSTNFTSLSKPFNLRVPFTPATIAVPEAVDQVQAAVKCAAKLKLTASARSGGHSYASWGLGGEDGHLVIDMKRFNKVQLDQGSKIATIGSGSRLGNIALGLYDQGKRAISQGMCPEVGLGGFVLHGGFGYSSRRKGLTLDAMVEAEVVLADGSLVKASQSENSDLFWALRGAGSSFGIVTNFKIQTFEAPEENTVFEYALGIENSSAAQTAIAAVQEFATTKQPKELQTRLFINKDAFSLVGIYYGPQKTFSEVIAPLTAKLGNPTGKIADKGWIDSLLKYSNGPLEQPLDFYDKHETFFCKSLMGPALSSDGLVALSDYLFTTAKANTRSWFLNIDLHGGQGSAISEVAVDATAYPHRNAVLKMQFYDNINSKFQFPADGMDLMNGWVQNVEKAMPDAVFGMYSNYADPSLSRDEAHKRYWGPNYAKLEEIKKKYDPEARFNNPQAVGSG